MSIAIQEGILEPEATVLAPSRLVVVPDRLPAPADSALKRAVDVAVAVVALLLLVPLFLVVALLVKATSRGPVFFRQERIGAGGRPFRLAKFRSMAADAEERLYQDEELYARYLANGYKLTVAEDPRITPLGRLLRKTSIDELPQLWNVLRGDMSLVGPRPVLAEELRGYGRHADAYLAARPGVTGLWQVSGRSNVNGVDRMELDSAYVREWSFGNDLLILARTPAAVLSCRGSL